MIFKLLLQIYGLVCSAGFILSIVKLAVDTKITWLGICIMFVSGPAIFLAILLIAIILGFINYCRKCLSGKNKIEKLMEKI